MDILTDGEADKISWVILHDDRFVKEIFRDNNFAFIFNPYLEVFSI